MDLNGKLLPILLIKDGKVVVGVKNRTDIQCLKLTGTKSYLIRTPEGEVLCSVNSSNFILPVKILGDFKPLNYVGNILPNPNHGLPYIFSGGDKQSVVGVCYNNSKKVAILPIKKFAFGGCEGFCWGEGVTIISDYLVEYYQGELYLFKGLELIYKWRSVNPSVVASVIEKGVADNKVNEYIELFNKLIGLNKLRAAVGRLRIDDLLKGYIEIEMQEIERLLNAPDLIEETISGMSRPCRQMLAAMAEISSVEPLITDSKCLEFLPQIVVEICRDGVHISLSGIRIVSFEGKIKKYYLRKSNPLYMFLRNFSVKNSLSNVLSQEQILLWARFLKNLDIDKQVKYYVN